MNISNDYPEVVELIKKLQDRLWEIPYVGSPIKIEVESDVYNTHSLGVMLPETHVAQTIHLSFRVYDEGEYSEE